MNTQISGRPLYSATAVAIILVVLVAVAALGASGTGTPRPSAGAPSVPPSASPTDAPTGAPSVPPSEAPVTGRFELDVDVAHEGPVKLVVEDDTDTIVDVTSGRASDGMSVRWGDVLVSNVDAATLRITWAGLPRAEAIALVVTAKGEQVSLDFAQLMPPANSDALGFDRVIVIEFDHPVRAEDVVATFPEFVSAG